MTIMTQRLQQLLAEQEDRQEFFPAKLLDARLETIGRYFDNFIMSSGFIDRLKLTRHLGPACDTIVHLLVHQWGIEQRNFTEHSNPAVYTTFAEEGHELTIR